MPNRSDDALVSASPAKASAFLADPVFRATFAALSKKLGTGMQRWLHTRCLVMLKPEALANGSAADCIAGLANHGFLVEHHRIQSLTREQVYAFRGLLRTSTTPMGVEATAAYLTAGPVALVVMRRNTPRGLVPASVALAEVKKTVRIQVGVDSDAINRLHTSDEPADFVRELGALTDGDVSWITEVQALKHSPRSSLLTHLQPLRITSEMDFSLDAALSRITASTYEHEARHGPSRESSDILLFCHRALGGAQLDFRHLFAVSRRLEIELDPWTRAVTAMELTNRFRWPKVEHWSGDLCGDAWRAASHDVACADELDRSAMSIE